MAKPPNKRPGEVSVRGLQRLIGLKYERDPKRGTRVAAITAADTSTSQWHHGSASRWMASFFSRQ